MLTVRLRDRVPSAVAISTGCVAGHLLRWHKQSRDGSGKCDAEFTGRNEDSVWGVLFEIDAAQKSVLDRAEGVGNGYIETHVNVVTDRGVVPAVAYVANAIDPLLRPYDWYKAFVLAGAREHGLPQEYIQTLEDFLSVPDPDVTRAAKNQSLLSLS